MFKVRANTADCGGVRKGRGGRAAATGHADPGTRWCGVSACDNSSVQRFNLFICSQLNAEPSISCHLDAFWESMYLR
jgi:hypothetical protein